MDFECIDTTDGDLIVKLCGEMDALGCTKIRTELEQITNTENSNVSLDLSQVSFLDSSGIGAIVFLYKRLKAQGRTLIIVGVQGQPQELMKLLRIDSAIPVSVMPVNELYDATPLQKTH
ncbi:MAG: STAS domain-containing protein [Gammaproteobacteria bacterium]|nr:STAS domain-containing protein [Gammaproteobacteria bacterium]MCF6259441.1 STAS domain-containing protein [Gammaproteobacteria bacterium]